MSLRGQDVASGITPKGWWIRNLPAGRQAPPRIKNSSDWWLLPPPNQHLPSIALTAKEGQTAQHQQRQCGGFGNHRNIIDAQIPYAPILPMTHCNLDFGGSKGWRQAECRSFLRSVDPRRPFRTGAREYQCSVVSACRENGVFCSETAWVCSINCSLVLRVEINPAVTRRSLDIMPTKFGNNGTVGVKQSCIKPTTSIW